MAIARRLRGVLGIAATWGVGLSVIATTLLTVGLALGIIPSSVFTPLQVLAVAIRNLVVGGAAGALFGLFLTSAERTQTLRSLSGSRVAAWGFLGFMIPAGLVALLSPLVYALPLAVSLASLAATGALGAVLSTTTIRLARRAPDTLTFGVSDPPALRIPTSHERLAGQPWDASYHHGPAPWDIGQPQPALVRLASEGRFTGAVLDAGCGTGENTLHLASLGLAVLGVDVAETALAIAREKAGDRGVDVEFAVCDALHMERLGRTFETVLDCGLFHAFDAHERARYAASLASVTEHDGTLYVLCFSDDGNDRGPHPMSQSDLRAAFSTTNGWTVAAIEPDRLQTRYHEHGAPAWLARIKRI